MEPQVCIFLDVTTPYKFKKTKYIAFFIGLSKGVMLSHANIISNCTAFRGKEVGITFDAIGDHQDVLPCVLPFFHIAGLVGTFLSKISQGCKLVTLPRFHPDTFLDALMKHKANALPVAPPISKICY